ncbi:MAG: hypothetical protein ACOX6D_03180 [Thermoguttaceae bacterium]|jgi:hypothetical protein
MIGGRRSRRDQGPTVSLFPFLAVLLCTMGMLIMLLVLIGRDTADREMVVAQEARSNDPLFSEEVLAELGDKQATATTPTEEALSPSEAEQLSSEDEQLYEEYMRTYGAMDPDEIDSQLESAEWFLNELKGVRERTETELTEERARLAEAEAAIAKLVAEIIELNEQALSLSEEIPSEEDADGLRQEIDTKAEEIVNLNRQIEELREKAKNDETKPTYAILPYRGKSGTFRRPLYIECDENGIRLMPERVQFIPEDFLVAKYPGNPFDAGLRAARQYYIEKGEGSRDNEPYPLLILKPESAQQYYIARAALASWGGDFGYEFVEGDAEIDYPRPDPELKRRVEEQVAMARVRLAGPIAVLLNELEANGNYVRFDTDDGEGAISGEGSGNRSEGGWGGDAGESFASRLGPHVRLESPGTGPTAGSYERGPSEGIAPENNGSGKDGGYRAAPVDGNHAASGLTAGGGADALDPSEIHMPEGPADAVDVGQLAAMGLPPEEKIGIFPSGQEPLLGPETSTDRNALAAQAPTPASAPDGVSSELTDENLPPPTKIAFTEDGINPEETESSGSEQSLPAATAADGGTIYAQGDRPYTAFPTAGEAVTLFAEATPKSEVPTSDPNAPAIDPRETVGNTTFRNGAAGSKTPAPEGAESVSADALQRENDPGKNVPKEPKVKAQRDKRAINLAEEMKKPSQTSIERPVTVVCGADTVLFPAQAGNRDPKTLAFRSSEDEQAILETIVACVRGWRAAGKDMYWSPWVRIKVESGGDETARRLSNLMRSQRVRVEQIGGEEP